MATGPHNDRLLATLNGLDKCFNHQRPFIREVADKSFGLAPGKSAEPVSIRCAALERIVEFSVYIPDRMEHSEAAIRELRRVCDRYLPNRYRISIMDQSFPANNRRIVSVPFVTTDLGGKGKNTFNLDGSETAALIAALEAEGANATPAPGVGNL